MNFVKKAVLTLSVLLALLAGDALAKTFYFLPPNDDPNWIMKTPHVLDMAGTVNKMEADANLCGWYKKDLTPAEESSNSIVVLQGGAISQQADRMGFKGVDESDGEWTGAPPMPTFIDFGERFTTLGANIIYFNPSEGESGWNTSHMGKTGTCTYKFAAIIYHTNTSKNSSFSFYGEGGREDGITRGIVNQKLAGSAQELKDGKGKIQFNNAQGTNWTGDNFGKAFKETDGTNVKRCFDMPFTRRPSFWEFDALNLCTDGTADYGTSCTKIGGFYPPNLMSKYEDGVDYTSKYSAMNNNRMYQGDAAVKPRDCVNMWCFDRGWYGGNCQKNQNGNGGDVIEIPSASRKDPGMTGDLSFVNSTTTKEEIDNYMKTICWQPIPAAPAIGNNQGYLYDYDHSIPLAYAGKTSGDVSGLMCFESAPATFVYEPGQEFFFRGDDDIWVFINNQLVVDLGGNHGPAPGYVKLDTIKTPVPLKKDSTYTLNVFFCDRRGPGSNVRISTNMYFDQKIGLYVSNGTGTTSTAQLCLSQGGGGGCDVAVGAGGGASLKCGEGGNLAGFIEFYIINRRGEEESITPLNLDNCRDTGGGELTCYGGIKVNTKNGTAKIEKNSLLGLPFTSGTLYARTVGVDPAPDPVRIASFASAVNVRMAWGTIKEGTAVNNKLVFPLQGNEKSICKQKPVASTGEYVPICFAAGDQMVNDFLIENVEDARNLPFSLNTAGFTNNADGKLKIYESNESMNGPDMSKPVAFTDLLKISYNGVLVLWVTGDYTQGEWDFDYTINVKGKTDNEVTLRSVVPKLAWVKGLGSTDRIEPANQMGAKRDDKWVPLKGTAADYEFNGWTLPEWVSVNIPFYLMAYRNDDEDKVVLCKTCNFNLILDAEAPGIPFTNSQLVNGTNLQIKNGEADIFISGAKTVMPPEHHAKITVKGEHNPDLQQAIWGELHFQEPPVPFPEVVQLFDRSGDGIGDSLVIIYNRGFEPDSLPNMIEVLWDKDTTAATVRYGIAGLTLFDNKEVYAFEGLPPAGTDSTAKKNRNREFWKTYLHLDSKTPVLGDRHGFDKNSMEQLKDTIILSKAPNSEDSARFSMDVLTKNPSGIIKSWASFCTGIGCDGSDRPRKNYNTAFAPGIADKIPAIVISATYKPGESSGGCGGSSTTSCQDDITLEFSEPVKIDTDASASPEEARNPFAYMLRDIGETDWKVLGSEFLPSYMYFFPSGNSVRPGSDGDSIVKLKFNRYRSENANSKTPMPGDSVKFAGNGWGATANAFVDGNGNKPNPKEIGRQIEGRKPFTPEKNPLGDVDPNNPDYAKETAKDAVKEICEKNGGCSPALEDRLKDLFGKGNPVEILPVDRSWSLREVKENYGGTVGILLNPDIFNEIEAIKERLKTEKNYTGPIPDEAISLRAKVFYHTNLGNYVADRAIAIGCNDPIFPISPSTGNPSCKDSRSKLYIAWDMKDSKGRLVGTGAYVGLYDFYWQVNLADDKGNQIINEKLSRIERKVEMHGVKRTKKR
jgi:fibro-slime domain-containing protein